MGPAGGLWKWWGWAGCGQAPGQMGETGADRAYCTDLWGRAVQGGAMTGCQLTVGHGLRPKSRSSGSGVLGQKPKGRSHSPPGNLIWGCLLVSGIQARPLVSSRMGFPPHL